LKARKEIKNILLYRPQPEHTNALPEAFAQYLPQKNHKTFHTKILGQKTFLKRVLTIGAHLGPNPRRQVAADVIVMANGKC
jgi:hypothetical protein